MNNDFKEISICEMEEVNGGALAGGLAGAILGGTVGLIVGTAKGVATGELSGNDLWKCCTTGAIAGAAIGAYTPV